MAAVSKELLLKPRLPEADVDIADVGTVRVRGLSRQEIFALEKLKATTDLSRIEAHFLAGGIVDPALTVEDVVAWQNNCTAGEPDVVLKKIMELSGIDGDDGGDGTAVRQFRVES